MADTTTNQKWVDAEEKRLESKEAEAGCQCAMSASKEGERERGREVAT